jgi:hypothetical protein
MYRAESLEAPTLVIGPFLVKGRSDGWPNRAGIG